MREEYSYSVIYGDTLEDLISNFQSMFAGYSKKRILYIDKVERTEYNRTYIKYVAVVELVIKIVEDHDVVSA